MPVARPPGHQKDFPKPKLYIRIRPPEGTSKDSFQVATVSAQAQVARSPVILPVNSGAENAALPRKDQPLGEKEASRHNGQSTLTSNNRVDQ